VEKTALLVSALALVAANLPFASERIFFVITPKSGRKRFIWRLAELVVFYFVMGGAAWLLEAKLGAVHKQGWEFYAVTASLFLVFAYPGFVVRYLWKSRE
jgi:Protein of unknown function (DUF2818)